MGCWMGQPTRQGLGVREGHRLPQSHAVGGRRRAGRGSHLSSWGERTAVPRETGGPSGPQASHHPRVMFPFNNEHQGPSGPGTRAGTNHGGGGAVMSGGQALTMGGGRRHEWGACQVRGPENVGAAAPAA